MCLINWGLYNPEDGYIDFSSLRLGVDEEGNIILLESEAHEHGHGAGMRHSYSIPRSKSIMSRVIDINPNRGPALPIDKKVSREIGYEDTYQHGRGSHEDGKLRTGDVLGRKWVK
jgi:hypothetical protein